jgi:hypothetical protein
MPRPSTKGAPTMHWPPCVGYVQSHVSEWSLSTLLSPILELQHAPLPLKVLWTKERAPTSPSSVVFYLDSHLNPLRSWECVNGSVLEETTTFSLTVLFMISHKGYIQMSFCPRTPKFGVLKFLKLCFLTFWKAITSFEDLWLKWGLKQNCSFHWNFSNNMWHVTYTHVIKGNLWLLWVGIKLAFWFPLFF